jgi:hypothetical protein
VLIGGPIYADICLLEANSRSICRDLLLNNTP